MGPCPDFEGWKLSIRIASEDVHRHLLLSRCASASKSAEKLTCAADIIHDETGGMTFIENEVATTWAPSNLNDALSSNLSRNVLRTGKRPIGDNLVRAMHIV
jgi:hypothetical protein